MDEGNLLCTAAFRSHQSFLRAQRRGSWIEASCHFDVCECQIRLQSISNSQMSMASPAGLLVVLEMCHACAIFPTTYAALTSVIKHPERHYVGHAADLEGRSRRMLARVAVHIQFAVSIGSRICVLTVLFTLVRGMMAAPRLSPPPPPQIASRGLASCVLQGFLNLGSVSSTSLRARSESNEYLVSTSRCQGSHWGSAASLVRIQ